MEEILIIWDSGDRYFVCLNEDSKMGYIQAQEDALLRLIDKTTPYEYK